MSVHRATTDSDTLTFGGEDVRSLMDSMRQSGVRLLEIDAPGRRLRLKLSPTDEARPSSAEASEPTTLVKAGSMGRFRLAHPDGLFPTCAVGAAVGHAQVLGFIQVRLLLLPVVAPRPGRLARILVSDDSLVGFGDPLFEIRHTRAAGGSGPAVQSDLT